MPNTTDERLKTLERKINGYAQVMSNFETRVDGLDNQLSEFVAFAKEQFSELFSQLKVASDMLEAINEEFIADNEEDDEEEDEDLSPEEFDELVDVLVDEIPELPFPVVEVDDDGTELEEETDDELLHDEV